MAKYKVKHTNIMHGERLYKEGSIIELSNDAAARLSDFVELIPETKAPTNKNSSKTKSDTSPEATENTDGGDINGK